MKLPISIFPNVTEYTKANWTGYLKPASVHLDSYSITEICKKTTTITQRPDGAIVMKKKPHETFESGDFNISGCSFTISEIPANSAMVIVHEAIKDAGDWKTQWTKGSAFNEFASVSAGTRLDSWSDAVKNLVIVSRLTKPLSGTQTFTFQYGYEGYHTVYFAFYDADRLDACLTGNHLKSISVGDKLGLVYWDGTECTEPGESMFCSTNDVYNVLVASYSPQDYGYGLKLLCNTTGKRTEPFLTKAGTVNLSGYDVKITGIETKGETLLKDHVFHVI